MGDRGYLKIKFIQQSDERTHQQVIPNEFPAFNCHVCLKYLGSIKLIHLPL
jgi:hypothetical protein